MSNFDFDFIVLAVVFLPIGYAVGNIVGFNSGLKIGARIWRESYEILIKLSCETLKNIGLKDGKDKIK